MHSVKEPGQITMQEAVVDVPLALSAKGIFKSYRGPGGSLEVLTGVDLEVRRGTILAILGVSGAGKSTLLNILGTLDRPDRGTLTLRDRRVDGLGEEELARIRARRIGFVFQFHHLLPEFTAEENVMMPLLIAGEGEARALAPEPELVLADEPSGNLDPAAARQLQDLLASLAREKHQTFVIVTHNDRLASLADRVLTLESGRLVATA